jgi:hypothetical protein
MRVVEAYSADWQVRCIVRKVAIIGGYTLLVPSSSGLWDATNCIEVTCTKSHIQIPHSRVLVSQGP